MNDNKKPTHRTHPQNQKTILVVGMLRIKEHTTCRIVENTLSLFKPNTMFGSIALIFGLIPLESKHCIDSI